ncbi:hypothetical protein VNI00_009750 [Paramarasmius palmivorus]|uniref:Carboxylic ester hydrolase n=1 Tax=Paramarasmius palmivorus TaxID=297713 RepID=A0AAW0CMW2_9AGAR
MFVQALVVVCTVAVFSARATRVQLGNTTLIGTQKLDVIEFFGGIPYAESPLGQLRLKPPILKPTLNVPIFNATTSGPECLQPLTTLAISEDCLTLNIHRPPDSVRGNKLLPVMIFIFGGGFLTGGAAELDGNPLVLRSIDRGTPIIYASINYRLGPLGFPQGIEAERNGALNLGLKDQLAALKWIKMNIIAFGGDPQKMTVFGQSAGAVSINILYLNSSLEKLVRGAILESGGAGTSFTFKASRRQEIWDSFVGAVPECSGVKPGNSFTCLRTTNSTSLLHGIGVSLAQANEYYPWVPVVDGPSGLLPELPSKMYARGQFAKIPFISGNNLDEATPFVSTTSTTDTIRNAIISNYTIECKGTGDIALQAAADRILQLYPNVPALGSPFRTGNETFGLSPEYKRAAAITGDLMFHSVRRLWTKAAVETGIRGYGYLFTGPRLSVFPPAFGVPHALELLYVFGLVAQNGGAPSDTALSLKIMDYWISFADTLDPNDRKGESRPTWPEYAVSDPSILELNAMNVSVILDDYRATGINFINSNPILFRH